MCGITGYTGKSDAVARLLSGLRALEYRGYDSAGVAVMDAQGAVHVVKTKGRLRALEERLEKCPVHGRCGIGHTRWATHGAPSDVNAHPHGTDRLYVVHNGIIENDRELRAELSARGYNFLSETDTEAAACTIDSAYAETGDPVAALCAAAKRLRGSYALGVIFLDHPNEIYAVREGNPLIVAEGGDGCMIASDIPAVLRFARDCYVMEDGEIACVREDGAEFFDCQGKPISKRAAAIEWNMEAAERGGFAHFMLKEIHEEPLVARQTLGRYVKDGLPDLRGAFDNGCERLTIVACGTAMHAGLVGKWLIERIARVPVEVCIASEFRYNEPVLSPNHCVIAISQSGETADTLAAVRLAKSLGVRTVGVVNVPGSSVAREVDQALITCAGPEISVASTKAYAVQLLMMYLTAVQLGLGRGTLSMERARQIVSGLMALPAAMEEVIREDAQIRRMAACLDETENCFFIGRGLDYPGAMEGSLKLKEITYIHSEAYAAGELKHGAISLITRGMPVVALSTQAALKEKMLSNMREVASRGARVLLLATPETKELASDADETFVLPATDDLLTPATAAVAMQLLAYYAAVRRGCDVDKPRNLAKSVTVE